MKWNKNIQKWVLITGCILAVLLISPFIIVQLYKDEIKTEIEKNIDENINGIVSFEKINYSFFFHFPNLTLAMNKVDVIGIHTFQKDTLAHIDRIDLQLNWFKLILKNKIEIDAVVLNKPIIHMLVQHDGSANYAIIKKDTINADTMEYAGISLDRFEIKEGTIRYLNESTRQWIEVYDIAHTGKIDIEKNKINYLTTTAVKHISVTDNDINYMHDKQLSLHMNLVFDLHSNTCFIQENAIELNTFRFGMDGSVRFLPKGYHVDMTFASKQASFSDILSLIPGTYKKELKNIHTEGLLTCTGKIKGDYYDTSAVIPAFHVDLKIADAVLQVQDFPSKIKDIQCNLEIENTSGIIDSTIINLKNFNMDVGGHPVKGRYKMQGFTDVYIDADILAELEFETIENIFPIRHCDIKGKLNFDLQAKGMYKKRKHGDDFEVTSIPAFDLNLTLREGTLKYDSAQATFHDIDLFLNGNNTDGNPEHTDFNLKSLEVFLGENVITGTVSVKGLNSCYIKSNLSASMDLADIEKLYPANTNIIKGLFKTDVIINGVYDTKNDLFPSVNALVSLTNGYLQTKGYSEPIENINFTARAVNTTGKAENTRVDFDQLNFLMEGNPFSMKGYIEDFVKMNYDFSIKGVLDLEKITKVFPIEGVTLLGMVDTDIESKGSIVDIENKNFSKITCAGNILLKQFKYRSPSFRMSLHVNEAYLKLAPDKIVMTKCNGRVGRTKFSMTGDLTNYMYFITSNNDMITGDINLKSDTLDLTPWIDKTYSRKRKSITTIPEPTPAPYTEPEIWEVPKNINFIFDAQIEHLFYQDLHITKLKGEIAIRNGILTLNETGFNSSNGYFSVDGDYNTVDSNRPFFDVHLDIRELDINKAYTEIALVRKLAPAAGDTYGKVSVNYKLSAELTHKGTIKLETLTGGGNVTVADAKINGMKMFDEISRSAKKQDIKNPDVKNVSMDSEIHDNKLFIKPFSLKVNGLNTDIEGSNDITGGNLNYLIKIELIPIDKMKIPFHVTGTYDAPKVTMGKGKKESR
jgi:AsmA protein